MSGQDMDCFYMIVNLHFSITKNIHPMPQAAAAVTISILRAYISKKYNLSKFFCAFKPMINETHLPEQLDFCLYYSKPNKSNSVQKVASQEHAWKICIGISKIHYNISKKGWVGLYSDGEIRWYFVLAFSIQRISIIH